MKKRTLELVPQSISAFESDDADDLIDILDDAFIDDVLNDKHNEPSDRGLEIEHIRDVVYSDNFEE